MHSSGTLLIAILAIVFGLSPMNKALAQQAQMGDGYVNQWIDSIPNMSTVSLEKELIELRLVTELSRSKLEIDTQYCRNDRDDAAQSRQALLQLNDLHRRNPVSGYGSQARQLQHENRAAIERYKVCFTEAIRAYYFDLGQADILSYEAHRAKWQSLPDARKAIHRDRGWRTFRLMADKVQEEIDRRSGDWGVGAQIAGFRGDFQVQDHPGGRWRSAGKNFKLREGSRIRTGNNSRVMLRYEDREAELEAIINIGANTEINIDDRRPDRRKPSDVSLIRGLIHIFKTATGEHPQAAPGKPMREFRVRAAVSICGIRGTELAISHDDRTGRTSYIMREGDAYVVSNGREVPLQANSVVTAMPDGQLSAPVSISDAQWGQIIGVTESRPQLASRTVSGGGQSGSNQVIRPSQNQRGFLGIQFLTRDHPAILSNEYPTLNNSVRMGKVLVLNVMEGGPAHQAGLRPSDEIIMVNDDLVSLDNFQTAVSKHPPGSRIPITYYQGGINEPSAIKVVFVTLTEAPQ